MRMCCKSRKTGHCVLYCFGMTSFTKDSLIFFQGIPYLFDHPLSTEPIMRLALLLFLPVAALAQSEFVDVTH